MITFLALKVLVGFHTPVTQDQIEACRGAGLVLKTQGVTDLYWSVLPSQCLVKGESYQFEVIACKKNNQTQEKVCAGFNVRVPASGGVYGPVSNRPDLTDAYNALERQ